MIFFMAIDATNFRRLSLMTVNDSGRKKNPVRQSVVAAEQACGQPLGFVQFVDVDFERNLLFTGKSN